MILVPVSTTSRRSRGDVEPESGVGRGAALRAGWARRPYQVIDGLAEHGSCRQRAKDSITA